MNTEEELDAFKEKILNSMSIPGAFFENAKNAIIGTPKSTPNVYIKMFEEAVRLNQIKVLEEAEKFLLEKANELKKKRKYRYIDEPFEPSILQN